jgi:hypothetical protein
MPHSVKAEFLEELTRRFGAIKKLNDSQSLVVGHFRILYPMGNISVACCLGDQTEKETAVRRKQPSRQCARRRDSRRGSPETKTEAAEAEAISTSGCRPFILPAYGEARLGMAGRGKVRQGVVTSNPVEKAGFSFWAR